VVKGYGVVRPKRTIASPPRDTRLHECYTRALLEPDKRLRPHQLQTSAAKRHDPAPVRDTYSLVAIGEKPAYEQAALNKTDL